jgi:hypothetical protein
LSALEEGGESLYRPSSSGICIYRLTSLES